MTVEGAETRFTDEVVFTVRKGGWYVTSIESDYWRPIVRTYGSDIKGVEAEMDADSMLPGVYFAPHSGADGIPGTNDDAAHVPDGVSIPICTPIQRTQNDVSNPVCYASNPPTSGPHARSAAAFRFYSSPVPKEMLLHSMEHGGVVIWYNTADAALIERLRQITESANVSRLLIVAAPYAEMEAETIALTSWTRIDKLPAASFDREHVLIFIQKHSRRYNPEGF